MKALKQSNSSFYNSHTLKTNHHCSMDCPTVASHLRVEEKYFLGSRQPLSDVAWKITNCTAMNRLSLVYFLGESFLGPKVSAGTHAVLKFMPSVCVRNNDFAANML